MLPKRVLNDLGGIEGRKLSIAALDKKKEDKRKASVLEAVMKPGEGGGVVVPEG